MAKKLSYLNQHILFFEHRTPGGYECKWPSFFPPYEDDNREHPYQNLDENAMFYSYHIHPVGVGETKCQCGSFAEVFAIDLFLITNETGIQFPGIYLPQFFKDSRGIIDWDKLILEIITRNDPDEQLQIIHTYKIPQTAYEIEEKLRYMLGDVDAGFVGNNLLFKSIEEVYYMIDWE